ncbi:MAG: hypothetical protein ISS45_05590 [Candidatus Omnitrophica bacterium]|nr:hypothetical protein [Candidatus Omnitrophota bacterium]
MIKKDKLLKQVEELVKLEQSLIPLLNKHLSAAMFFSNLKKDDRENIVEYFQKLVIAKTKHVEILNGVKAEITRRERDVY